MIPFFQNLNWRIQERLRNIFGEKNLPLRYPQPVVVVNDPQFYALNRQFVSTGTASDATSATIMNSSPTGDTYITCIQLSCTHTSLTVTRNARIETTINGVTTVLAQINLDATSGQAAAQSIVIPLPIPLRIDRGVAVNVVNSSGAASVDTTGIVYGYVEQYSSQAR